MIIRGFLGYLHIMNMGFTDASRRDFNKLRFCVHFINRSAAEIPHARAQPSYELMNDRYHATLEGNPAFHSLWNQFF